MYGIHEGFPSNKWVTAPEIIAKLVEIQTPEAHQQVASVAHLIQNGSRYSNQDFDVLSSALGTIWRHKNPEKIAA